MLTYGFPFEDESAAPLPVYGVAGILGITLLGLPGGHCATPAQGCSLASLSLCLPSC